MNADIKQKQPRQVNMPNMSHEKYVVDMYKSLNIPSRESGNQ